jgi:FixJ family two-component response regulator
MAPPPQISVVDDDHAVRKSLQSLIRSLGFAVDVFASAEEFLNSDHLRTTRCLILDVRMPRMNGLELQRRLIDGNHGIPVVLITAHGDDATRSQALKNGAVDFLSKPFTDQALVNAIDAALSLQVSWENRPELGVSDRKKRNGLVVT